MNEANQKEVIELTADLHDVSLNDDTPENRAEQRGLVDQIKRLLDWKRGGVGAGVYVHLDDEFLKHAYCDRSRGRKVS